MRPRQHVEQLKTRNKTPDAETGASVRLVAVPSFAKTGALVLLNLRTLQCQLMHFGAWRGGEQQGQHQGHQGQE